MEKQLLITKEQIKPSRPDFEVIGAFNPGCISYQDETLLLIRVAERPIQNDSIHYLVPIYSPLAKTVTIEKIDRYNKDYDFSDKRVIANGKQKYLTSISHFRLARSKDGIQYTIADQPTIFPETIYEEFGIEDPRITKIGKFYYISYSAVSRHGINGCIIKTKDFITFERMGIAFTSDNKDIVLFPKKIKGSYYALHRPSSSEYGKLDIWMASSKDLIHWGNHSIFLKSRKESYDNFRLGASAVPFLDKHGWIEIYHSGNLDNEYSLSTVLLDKHNPSIVLKRSKEALIKPEEKYEINGFFGKVVFSCGAIVNHDHVLVYYGVSDENIACAKISFGELYQNLGIA
jgi:beta-1,2-mannobiose phosphorylase / 1,2-beta-oligomannan phosphorylase